jgi:hypothetical protein
MLTQEIPILDYTLGSLEGTVGFGFDSGELQSRFQSKSLSIKVAFS